MTGTVPPQPVAFYASGETVGRVFGATFAFLNNVVNLPRTFRCLSLSVTFKNKGITAEVTMSLGPVKYLSKFVVRIHLLFLCGERQSSPAAMEHSGIAVRCSALFGCKLKLMHNIQEQYQCAFHPAWKVAKGISLSAIGSCFQKQTVDISPAMNQN